MTSRYAARRGRRKLRAHDRGLNRHHKVLSWMQKKNRLAAEQAFRRQHKKRPPKEDRVEDAQTPPAPPVKPPAYPCLEPVRPGTERYAQAVCGLPGCGEALYILYETLRPVFLSDLVDDLADPGAGYTQTWRVECSAGHVLLLPADSSREVQAFGYCPCCGSEHPQQGCDYDADDLARLREVIGDGERTPR